MFENPFLQKIGSELWQELSLPIFGVASSDRTFLKSAWAGKCKFHDPEKLREYFAQRGPRFSLINHTEIVKDIDKQKIIARADKICKHIYNFLGTGDIDSGHLINWHCDFKTNYCWSANKPFKRVEIPYGKADIKIPWELSRFQEAVMLGQAYGLTGDEKYATEFIDQITDWIERNPAGKGVNWQCAMEVAIRACNWIAGYYFFKNSPQITAVFLTRFLKSIYQHARHIAFNLEYSPQLTTNHYLSNLVGLVYVGTAFPEFREAAQWRTFGLSQLKKEMNKQVLPDGCSFEGSTSYHRLALELFFYPTWLTVVNSKKFAGQNYAEVARKVFGNDYTVRLYRMFEAVLFLLKPNGMIPQIGDNDSGRLHIFHERNVLDHRYLLAYGAIFFNEDKFKIEEFGLTPEALWVFGQAGKDAWDTLKSRSLCDLPSRVFEAAGWTIMRSGKNYLLISAGKIGQGGFGGHDHNDRLSLEWQVNGEDVIVDPGTYVYTSEPQARNQFRATSFHNTVMIDQKEQNRFSPRPEGLFNLSYDIQPKILRWETNKYSDVFLGEIKRYGGIKPAITHQRKFFWVKGNPHILTITDSFIGEGKHSLEWNFHFPAALEKRLVISGQKMLWELEETFFSPAYGEKVGALKATARLTVQFPFEVDIFIKLKSGDQTGI